MATATTPILTDPEKKERERLVAEAEKKAAEVNKARGKEKGTRVRVGQTRGRNVQVITWEAFDESIPESMPKTLNEFMELTGTKDQNTILAYVIEGFNDANYTAASDPIAEFVNPEWDVEVQKAFRTTIRNYVAGTNGMFTIEQAVELMKPGIEKAFAAKKAQDAANAQQPSAGK